MTSSAATMVARNFLVLAATYASAAIAAPAPSVGPPTVRLDDGTFTGVSYGISDAFLGIKFAEAP